MGFDTLLLESFIAVAETGSFTKGAAHVRRTQSAISQQISKLETQLGAPLFKRGKTLTLTPQGEIFLGYARQILALHREALDRFKEPDLQGEVRFGLPEDFATIYLSEVLAEFAKLHPRIVLKVECDFTLNLLERFKKQEFDLVLVKLNHPETFPHGIDIWSESLEWVGLPETLQPGKPLPLVLSPPPCVYRARALHALEEKKQSWRILFSSPSYASTLAAVRAGMGITVLPRTMVPGDLPLLTQNAQLPTLTDTHISLLKHSSTSAAINSLEKFVLEKLHP